MTTASFDCQVKANAENRLFLWNIICIHEIFDKSRCINCICVILPPISNPSCFPFFRSFNFCLDLSLSLSFRFSLSTSFSSFSFFFLSFSFSVSFSFASFSLDFSRFSFLDGNLKALVFFDFEGLLCKIYTLVSILYKTLEKNHLKSNLQSIIILYHGSKNIWTEYKTNE